MSRRLIVFLLAVALLLAGCWDRVELEDQLFPTAVAVDKDTTQHYKVTLHVPVPGGLKAGILGGQGIPGHASEEISGESDSLIQAMFVLNGSVARRISTRHIRVVIVGEELAREGLFPLLSSLSRHAQVRSTVGFIVAHGTAAPAITQAKFTAESNPAKITEGILIVNKYLHLAPPIRLHHMLNRGSGIGIDPFAPSIAINERVTTGESQPGLRRGESAEAGGLARDEGNPIEVVGSAVFRKLTLAGFLTVDETQALLAMRGEMGKAYMTLSDSHQASGRVLVRYHQENLPKYITSFTSKGPAITVRLLLEGEVLTGTSDFRRPEERRRLEQLAADHMKETADRVVSRLLEWRADPVGFGLRFRKHFRTWPEWEHYQWRQQLPRLQVRVEVIMRLRRFGMTLGTEQVEEMKE
jgi:Ger(x)C family germination protein